MTAPLGNQLLCTDDRMLRGAGTGVATYARALRAAQQRLSLRALLLSAGEARAVGAPQSPADKWRRRARAVLPGPARARADAEGFVRHDLFRLGQAFFSVHRRPLPVRVPGPPGMMHWSYPVPMRIVGWRNLYTIHDAIPLTHPALTPIDEARHRRLLRALAARADALVTVSAAAAAEIAAALDLPAGRLVDCSQPVEIDAEAVGDGIPAGLVPGRYLLVCGTVEGRKNVSRIAHAYRASGVELPLVVAGPDGWDAAAIAAVLRDTPGVVRLPYQTRAAMLALLAGARALVMPSLAEGFGLPVAEAMALGTPVITAAGGALAETAGGAALLVDPLDMAALAEAMCAVARDDVLAAKLAAVGRRRAATFSAEAFAARLRALYEQILQV